MKRSSADGAKSERRYELCGVNPILEALRAGRRTIEEITVAEGARNPHLNELLDLARNEKIAVRHAPRAKLDREAGTNNHQGVIARVSAARYVDAEELLTSIELKIQSEQSPLIVLLRRRRSAEFRSNPAHCGLRRRPGGVRSGAPGGGVDGYSCKGGRRRA